MIRIDAGHIERTDTVIKHPNAWAIQAPDYGAACAGSKET